MSYHVYTTPGIILKRQVSGEADTVLSVLTKDLGLIRAKATSTRLVSSKLKNSLQEYSLTRISCVKGKNGWKITSATSDTNFYFEYPKYKHKVIARIFSVLLKTITGEFPEKTIFEITHSGLISLKGTNQEELPQFEALIILRIMNVLGYVNPEDDIKNYLNDYSDWGVDILSRVKEDKIRIVSVINKALKESHL